MTADALQVRCWGVRGSYPVTDPGMQRYGGNTPCIEVRVPDGGLIVIDAGTGIIGLGETLVEAAPERTASDISTPGCGIDLLISHLHWDHLQGLPFFAPLHRAGTIRAWSNREAADLLAALRLQVSSPGFPVQLDDLASTVQTRRIDGVAEIAGARVTAFPLRHPGGCAGYRIEHGGGSVVYASDHELGDAGMDRELHEQARGADFLVLDAQYDEDAYATRKGWGHSTWERAVTLASDLQVGRLLLFHHDPRADDRRLDAIQERASRLFPIAEVAIEGRTYTVPGC